MNQDNLQDKNEDQHPEDVDPKTSYDPRPLVLHVRSCRKYYGRVGLTQNELSLGTGISERTIRTMETDRELAAPIEALLRLAKFHRVHMEDLVASPIVAAISAEVEERRQRAGLDAGDGFDQGCSRCHVHEF